MGNKALTSPIERARVDNSPPKAVRAALLPDLPTECLNKFWPEKILAYYSYEQYSWAVFTIGPQWGGTPRSSEADRSWHGSLCPRRHVVQLRRACRAAHGRGGGHQARRGARDAYCDALLSRYRRHGDVLHALRLAGYDACSGQLLPV